MPDNGSVFVRKDGRICATYIDASGKRRYLYRRTKTLAKQALREALKDRDDGIAPSNLTVREVINKWLEISADEVSVRTFSHRESLVRVHFLNHPIANMKVNAVGEEHIREYMRGKKHLAPSTRGKLLRVLRYVGSEGIRLGILKHNPAASIKAPRDDRRELDILSPGEIKQLLNSVMGQRYELIVVLGAACGIRVGEALGAMWSDIDFEKGTISIKRTVWRGSILPTKTVDSTRTLKLPQRTLEALTRRYDGSTSYLCPTRSGNHTADSNFHNEWKRILGKAGLPRKTTFHSLRHGAASILLNQNVPIPVVSRFLGHSNPGITLRVYSHMIDGMGGMAASGMDDALS